MFPGIHIARLSGSLLLLAYPLASVKGVPKRVLPWSLYGSVALLMAPVVHEQLQYGRAMEMLFTGSLMIFMTRILGMPFPWRVNAICEMVLFLIFAASMYVAFGLSPLTLRVGMMSLLMVIVIDFIHRKFERILRIEHDHLRRIEKMAIKDVLSGQYNRRFFLEIGARIMLRSNRYGRPVSLALVDIDHFKRVNDRFGHDAGDVVIGETARCIRQKVRETDVVAERVRQDIETSPIAVESLSYPVTITASLGVAEARPELDSLKTLIKRADQALYRAKEAGRNRVVLQDEGLGSTSKTP